MQGTTPRMTFDEWLSAVETLAAGRRRVSDPDLKVELRLPTEQAVRHLRRRVRRAIRNKALGAVLPERTVQAPARRSQRNAVPPISEWYAPHMS